jgi:hypothetical protein
MKYQKPEVNVLGDAARVIQFTTNKVGSSLDQLNPSKPVIAAYDLDE